MNAPQSLSTEQIIQAKAICDEICERLQTTEECNYDLNEQRGEPGSFIDDVWDHAMMLLRRVGWDASRKGAVIHVRKR